MKRQIQQKQRSNNSETHQVKSFEGYYSYLNNDHPTWVQFDGILFPSITTAFQAARSDDISIRKNISNISDVQEFKAIVMSIKNPPDWNQRRYHIMLNLTRDKFKRNKELTEKLIGTKDKKLINGFKKSGINEQYWGVFEGNGRNMLGKIIMTVREQFLKGQDTKNWIETLKLEKDIKMFPKVNLLVEKGGKKIDKLFLEKKSFYTFGKIKNCDFQLQNPTISRYHSCVYFSSEMQVILLDLNSTHGTILNKERIESLVDYKVNKDDIIQFGTSQRTYTVQIDWSQMQTNLKETENELRSEMERNKFKNQTIQYDKLSKDQVKNYLGVQQKCLIIEGYLPNFREIQAELQKYAKIKKVRKVVDKKTGKPQSSIIYFNSASEVNNIWNNTNELRKKLKIKKCSQRYGQKLLNEEEVQERQRSRESHKHEH